MEHYKDRYNEFQRYKLLHRIKKDLQLIMKDKLEYTNDEKKNKATEIIHNWKVCFD
jgi:hypothetical protein